MSRPRYFFIVEGSKEASFVDEDSVDWDRIDRVRYKSSGIDLSDIGEYNYIRVLLKSGGSIGPLPFEHFINEVGDNPSIADILLMAGIEPYRRAPE